MIKLCRVYVKTLTIILGMRCFVNISLMWKCLKYSVDFVSLLIFKRLKRNQSKTYKYHS